jgi:hypothetical protein
VWLIKTDASGTEEWSQTLGGGDHDWGQSVRPTWDDGYIIAGFTESYGSGGSDVYLIKSDAAGEEQWSQTFGGVNQEYGYDVQQTSDGGYIITGYKEDGPGGYGDVWLIRLGYATNVVPPDQSQWVTTCSLTARPNPFKAATLLRFEIPTAGDVRISLHDTQGRVVVTMTDSWKWSGSNQVLFRAPHLCPGVYLARVTAGDFVQTRKLMVVK